ARFLEAMGISCPPDARKLPSSMLDSAGEAVENLTGKEGGEDGVVLSSRPDDVELPGTVQGNVSGARVVDVQVSKSDHQSIAPSGAGASWKLDTNRTAASEAADDDVPPPLDPVKTEGGVAGVVRSEADSSAPEEMPPPLEPDTKSTEVASFSDSVNDGILPPAADSVSEIDEEAVHFEEPPITQDELRPEFPEEPVSESPDAVESPVDPSAEPAAINDSLHLHCPKCEGELVLRREHLGVEGACVWCGIQIVAAESGLDRQVRVFPVFQPSPPKDAPQSPSPEVEDENSKEAIELSLDTGKETPEKGGVALPETVIEKRADMPIEPVSDEPDIDQQPESNPVSENEFAGQAASWSGMTSLPEPEDSPALDEGTPSFSSFSDLAEEVELPAVDPDSSAIGPFPASDPDPVNESESELGVPDSWSAGFPDQIPGETDGPSGSESPDMEFSADEAGFGNLSFGNVPHEQQPVNFDSEMSPNSGEQEEEPAIEGFTGDASANDEKGELPEGFSSAFSSQQMPSEDGAMPLSDPSPGASPENTSFDAPPAPMGFGEIIGSPDQPSGNTFVESASLDDAPAPASFFTTGPSPAEDTTEERVLPEPSPLAVELPAEDVHIDMPEPGSAAGGFSIPSSTGLESFSAFAPSTDEAPAFPGASTESAAEAPPSPVDSFPTQLNEGEESGSFPTSWGGEDTSTDSDATGAETPVAKETSLEEPDSSLPAAPALTEEDTGIEKSAFLPEAGGDSAGANLFGTAISTDSQEDKNETVGGADHFAPVSNVEKSPIGEIKAPAPDGGKGASGRKPRKGLIILLVILIGFVSGAAAASFFLPVEKYVLKAQAFMESKFNPGAVKSSPFSGDVGAGAPGVVEPDPGVAPSPGTSPLPATSSPAEFPQVSPQQPSGPQN
ncbi:MAG: hypothetical protein MI807_20560, partial [Verrucomicrobiales bacterium]|nr:hypothetical protein [Verrucomicrobiales bacterium]